MKHCDLVKMCVFGFIFIILSADLAISSGFQDASSPNVHSHKYRRNRAASDGALRFEPQLYNKKMELNSSGKIHCKVAGAVNPTVQWFLNESSPLPEGVASSNGTLVVTRALREHTAKYTCRAMDGDKTIQHTISLDVVVSPRVSSPLPGARVSAVAGSPLRLSCRAEGDPAPVTHWDRNTTILHPRLNEVDVEGGANASTARIVVYKNGTLIFRSTLESDSARYGCTAGSSAGLARNELLLTVYPEGTVLGEEAEGGRALIVSVCVAAAYMALVLALTLYCRRRRDRRRGGEKLELEMAEGREKLVEEEEKKTGNGAAPNGRLLPHERDSGADNSEVSAVSRASKKSAHEHLSVPRTLLQEQITLGRGEFGDVILAKLDMCQVKKLRSKDIEGEKIRPVLVKVLATKDETQLCEFRRQLDMFSRVRHANLVRLIGLCDEQSPHYMLLEHTDWGELKSFLVAARTTVPAPQPAHRALLVAHLAQAGQALAVTRRTHRDIAARNCVITSQLHLKLSLPALTRGPYTQEYYKLHDQVVPLRWMPLEAVSEGEYSTKSDVYMFAATVWEIYTDAELPFTKLNDNSVLDRLKNNTLEWTIPSGMPERLAELLKRCWSVSPKDRPQFTEICEEVNAVLQSITAENQTQTTEETVAEI